MIDPARHLLLSMGLPTAPRYPGGPPGPRRPALRRLCPATGEVLTLASPPVTWHPGDREDAELTGASWDGGLRLQCTRTTLLWMDPRDGAVVRAMHHPLFFDLHHALRTPGGHIAVAATGHDSVLELDDAGQLLAHTWLGHPDGRPRAAARDPEGFRDAYGDVDFSRLPFDATKPRRVHPNHLLWLHDRLWVTGLRDHRLRPLDGSAPGVTLPAPPHDGVTLEDGTIGLTTVDGHVLRLAPDDLRVVDDLDLGALDPSPRLAGWCRGLTSCDGLLWVGMTTLRRSPQVELLRYVLRGEGGLKRPTRVLALDPARRRLVGQWEVGVHGEGTLYDLAALPSPAAERRAEEPADR